jgi:hypothetical protein
MIVFEFIIKAFTELVINIILAFPGALVRWIFSNKTRTVKEIYTDGDIFVNAGIGGCVVVALILTFYLFLN